MSLVSTLGRVAMGVLVAKGVGKMMGGGQGRAQGRAMPGGQSGGGLGGLLGGLMGGSGGGLGGGLSGGLGGGLGSALGGGSSGGGLGGGLGGMLGGGGLGNLGALLGGRGGGAAAGGLGGLLESLGGGGRATQADASRPPSGGSFGGLLNSALQGEDVPEPDASQEALARVMLQAMIGAANSDGEIDEEEQKRILSHLGDDVSEEERQFVLAEMRSPTDTDALVRSVPSGAEAQVYTMSLMGIDLDSQAEARYLDSLRQKLGLSEEACNDVHHKLGVPTLYS